MRADSPFGFVFGAAAVQMKFSIERKVVRPRHSLSEKWILCPTLWSFVSLW